MKVAVIGSRTFSDYAWMKQVLDTFDITHIVSGGNGKKNQKGEVISGADMFAVQYAKEKGIPFTEYLPDWDLHGKAAGPIRNKLIVDDSESLIAFWDGGSRGTKSSLDYAANFTKPCYIYPLRDQQEF